MKAALNVLAAILAVIVIGGCTSQPQLPQQPKQQQPECSSDSDCGVGGCSGQVCATAAEAPGIITTCEYREEYGCLKLTSCGCVEGKCMWQQNIGYTACLDEAKSQPQPQQPQ